MGNKNISVWDRNGNARYPKWVIYQYQLNAIAYNVLAIINGIHPSPNVIGIEKNCTTSVK
jgi:hypothetical protein